MENLIEITTERLRIRKGTGYMKESDIRNCNLKSKANLVPLVFYTIMLNVKN